ncbi:MAG: ATP-binding cassette domain-containing protein, partial [Actinobacteria bacterium]|nr:ATP-binding cassette domain-containing protein [Actinomycetota bacterium]
RPRRRSTTDTPNSPSPPRRGVGERSVRYDTSNTGSLYPEPVMPTAVRIDNLHFRYPVFDPDAVGPSGMEPGFALAGIDLEIAEGEFLGISGTTGSGKTTLAMLIARSTSRRRGREAVETFSPSRGDGGRDGRRGAGPTTRSPATKGQPWNTDSSAAPASRSRC